VGGFPALRLLVKYAAYCLAEGLLSCSVKNFAGMCPGGTAILGVLYNCSYTSGMQLLSALLSTPPIITLSTGQEKLLPYCPQILRWPSADGRADREVILLAT